MKTGAVIIYKRASADDEFQDVFELVPENGAVEDVEGQFGVSVAMNEDVRIFSLLLSATPHL